MAKKQSMKSVVKAVEKRGFKVCMPLIICLN